MQTMNSSSDSNSLSILEPPPVASGIGSNDNSNNDNNNNNDEVVVDHDVPTSSETPETRSEGGVNEQDEQDAQAMNGTTTAHAMMDEKESLALDQSLATKENLPNNRAQESSCTAAVDQQQEDPAAGVADLGAGTADIGTAGTADAGTADAGTAGTGIAAADPHSETNGIASVASSSHFEQQPVSSREADERQAMDSMQIPDESMDCTEGPDDWSGPDEGNGNNNNSAMNDSDPLEEAIARELSGSDAEEGSTNSRNDSDPLEEAIARELSGTYAGVSTNTMNDPDTTDTAAGVSHTMNHLDPFLDAAIAQELRGKAPQDDSAMNGETTATAAGPQPLPPAREFTRTQPESREMATHAAVQAPVAHSNEVIELLDDDDDDEAENLVKRQKVSHENEPMQDATNGAMTAHAAYQSRAAHMPEWMQKAAQQRSGVPIQPGATFPPDTSTQPQMYQPSPVTSSSHMVHQQQQQQPPAAAAMPPILQSMYTFNEPQYVALPDGFVPTWKELVPAKPKAPPPQPKGNQHKYFQLSLLNINEFTISGLPIGYDCPPTSVAGLRVPIRQISRDHGKAIYERDKEGGTGKWRIPLGAYHAFEAYLRSDAYCRVQGIAPLQLNIASLERARQEKGYPTVEHLVEAGVPKGLAKTLAPFQRGGVDFILEKGGRGLIADDMGLGKTIQAIAAMSVYRHEWPILVLSPSSARYHWSTEFKNWLGVDSEINKPTTKDGEDNINGDAGGSCDEASTDEDLLEESQIHVLTSSKDDILPNPSTKVVICSYGLAPMLIQSGAITPGMFRCAIVDESHMLKNKKTKRTALLMPILNAAGRCVLLSGTPALSRPSELYPQLVILGTERHGWWEDEADFMDKYVKGATARRRAELHTMLTGTVMIRRLKVDILKTLPHKLREKAALHVLNEDQRCVFKKLLMQLRESKGALGKIARKQYADRTSSETGEADALGEQPNEKLEAASAPAPQFAGSPGEALAAASLVLQKDYEKRLNEGKAQCSEVVTSSASHLGLTEQQQILHQLEGKLIADLDDEFKQKMEQIRDWLPTVNNGPPAPPPAEHDRTTVLNRLYSLTGDAKVPVIVDMLKRWLRDPTKGKICIFAHHISVLDSISVLAELSNSEDSNTKYIRIDGSTLPKKRQEQINDFQTDPSIRVAILGITAAGVAVTLTASSTVWFAELFWTPAIMIQAEDRCHRIGQQARVRCLYFVAKGTLDDVLFRLLEKKLQDIGEFVEGKEKLKYVINKTYDTTKELHKMFDVGEDSDSEEDGGMDDIDFDKELPLDEELEHDIEQLGEEEERMLQQADKYDDDPEASGAATGSDSDDRKMPAVEIPEEAELGRTEEEAITLLESDDEEEKESPSADAAASATFKENGGATAAAAATEEGGSELAVAPAKRAFDLQGPLHQCRLYRIHITGPTLGISVAFFQNRVVVERLTQDRIERFGEHSKPVVGDVLVGINGQRLPMINSLGQVLQHLRHVLMRPPVELTFAEDPDFVEHYKNVMRFHPAKQNRLHAATPAAPPRPPPVVDDNGVIDLIDDD